MKKIILDFSGVPEKRLHDYLAEKFSFPAHYGKNFDALYDLLTEISSPVCVGVFNTEGKNFSPLIQVLKDAEQDNKNLCVVFSKLELN